MRELTEAGQERRAHILLFWALATALPITVLFNVEVWLQSSYTGPMFHLRGFLDLYLTGIFRYRILGRVLLLKTNELLLHFMRQKPYPMPRDPEGELSLVAAYAVLNGSCLLLSNFLLLGLMWVRRRGFRTEALPLYFFTFLLIAVSMSAVTPYDQLAYLLLLVAVAGASVRSPILAYSLVSVSAVAGILNRETEFLGTALLATLALFAPVPQRKRFRGLTAVHLLLCLAGYLALRKLVPGPAAVSSITVYGGKWAGPAAVDDLLLFSACLPLARLLYRDLRPALVFTAFSLPYLIPVLLTGVLRELRLLVPLILCIFCVYVILNREDARRHSAP